VIEEEEEEIYFEPSILERLDRQMLEQLLGDFIIISQLKIQTVEWLRKKIKLHEEHEDFTINEYGVVHPYDVKARICDMIRNFINDLGILAMNSTIETIVIILQELIEAAVRLYIANRVERGPL